MPACLKIPEDLSSPDGGVPAAPTTAAELLDRHIRALGGTEKLNAIQQRTVEARMVFRAEEDCEAGRQDCFAEDQTGSFVLHTTADGRLYRRTLLGDLVEERGYDGKTGWSMGNDRMLRLDAPDEVVVSREDALLHWYFGVDKRGIETALVAPRDRDSDERPVVLDGIEWRIDATTPPKTLWFDRATGLLREETIEEGEGAERRQQVIVYDDYQAVDGVLVAFDIRVINRIDDGEQTVVFETQRVSHAPVDDKKFAIPVIDKPKPTPDKVLAAVAAARTEATANPRDLGAQVALVRAEFTAGHFDAAVRASQAALALDAKEPEALYTLARAQLLLGDLAGAERTLNRAAKSGVRADAIARQRAWIYARNADFPKLAKALDAAGGAPMAGRYRSFTGKPYTPVPTKECVTSSKLSSATPLLLASIALDDKVGDAVIDTASAEVIVSESFAKEVGITIRARAEFDEQAPQVGYGQASRLTVGGVTLQNVPVAVIADAIVADMSGDSTGKVRAVLGTHVLSRYLVTIDTKSSTLELVAPGATCKAARDARRTGTGIPFFLHEAHHIYVASQMEGAEGLYLLNTGMRGADLAATMIAYGNAGVGAPALRSDEVPMVTIERFAMGPFTASKLAAAFGFFEQSESADAFRLDGMIGLGAFGGQPFTLDYEQQRIWTKP
jgi:tetratricopeptide (TPR) repeat protein